MSARRRPALLAFAASVSLLFAQGAAGVEARTPVPGAQPVPQKLATPTPPPVLTNQVLTNDLALNLPVCSVVGKLTWDAQLLKQSNTPPPPYSVNKSAYSGSMTITANKPLKGFLPLKVEASIVGVGDIGDCGSWTAQQVDLAKGQSKTYPVECIWGSKDTSGLAVEGVVKIGYAGGLKYCDGKVTIGK